VAVQRTPISPQFCRSFHKRFFWLLFLALRHCFVSRKPGSFPRSPLLPTILPPGRVFFIIPPTGPPLSKLPSVFSFVVAVSGEVRKSICFFLAPLLDLRRDVPENSPLGFPFSFFPPRAWLVDLALSPLFPPSSKSAFLGIDRRAPPFFFLSVPP